MIRAIILVESLPAVYQMEEMLHALGPYAAGLNAARWDLKASILEYVMTEPESVWPDRFGVDIKTTDFIAISSGDSSASASRGAPFPSEGWRRVAGPRPGGERSRRRVDPGRQGVEAHQGFLRGWVAHIFHMKPAADPFKNLIGSGWKPTAEMADPDSYPVEIEAPKGLSPSRGPVATSARSSSTWRAG